MSVDFKELGNSISDIRKEWGYTQKEVYNLSKVSIETQRRIEHGLKEPKISTLERLSLVYKTDLVKLALQTRKRSSYFSDDMIKFVNKTVWMRDVELAKRLIKDYIDELKAYMNQLEVADELEMELFQCLLDFLLVVKDSDISDIRNKEQNYILMEKLLFRLNRESGGYLRDCYLFNLEVTIGLFLCNVLKMSGEVEKSFEILDTLERAVKRSKVNDRRNEDYIMTIAINRIVNYEILREFDKALEMCDQLLINGNNFVGNVLWKDILFIKGISMYHLEQEGFEFFLHPILMMEKGARKKACLDELEYYGIDIKIPESQME